MQETGASTCMVVPSPAAAPFGLHLSAPAQAATWLQPLPRHGLLFPPFCSSLVFFPPSPPALASFLLFLSATTLTLRCFHRGTTDSSEDGLCHALRWVHLNRREPAVTDSGQPPGSALHSHDEIMFAFCRSLHEVLSTCICQLCKFTEQSDLMMFSLSGKR